MTDFHNIHVAWRCSRCGDWLSYGRCKHGCDLPDPHLNEETERLGCFPAPIRARRLFAEERSR